MAIGTVKWFNDASDYSFIVRLGAGSDLYVRGSNFVADPRTCVCARELRLRLSPKLARRRCSSVMPGGGAPSTI
jgi:hypothetical protein